MDGATTKKKPCLGCIYFFRFGLIIIPYLTLDLLSGGFPSVLNNMLSNLNVDETKYHRTGSAPTSS
jgi:hypothetical protein